MQLHRGLDFTEVHESIEDVVLLHSIEKFPSVIVIKVKSRYSSLGITLRKLYSVNNVLTHTIWLEQHYWE